MKTNLVKNASWNRHLANWGVYAAAAGASLSMATTADASIISGTLNVTATINPAAGVNGSAEPAFVVGGANEAVVVRNIAAHSTFNPIGPGNRGPGSCSSSPGNPMCQTFVPRAGVAVLDPHLFNGQQWKFFDNNLNDQARAYLRNSVIAGGAANQQQTAFLDTNGGAGQRGNFPFGATNDFVGFKTAGGDLGWLQVQVLDRNADGYPDQVLAIAFGYNTVAGASIRAGQTGTAPTAPEPGTASLALLAAGAAGIVALRKARQTKTQG
jgi:hypothetical protein